MTQKLNKNGKPRAPTNSIRIQGLSLEQIAEQSGKHITTIYKRYLNGLSDQEIIHGKTKAPKQAKKPKPKKPPRPVITIEGKTIAEIAKLTGMKPHTIRSRHLAGWSLEKIMNTPINPNMSRTQERPSAIDNAIGDQWQPDPVIQTIAQSLSPSARLFCGVINLQQSRQTA